MASARSGLPLDSSDIDLPKRPYRQLSRNSIVINRQRLEKIRRKVSDPAKKDHSTSKSAFTVDDGDGIHSTDAILAARERAARRAKGLDSFSVEGLDSFAEEDTFDDIIAAVGAKRSAGNRNARDSIALAHNRLGASPISLFTKSPQAHAVAADEEMTSEMQRLQIIEAARKRAIRHKQHGDSISAFEGTPSGDTIRRLRSRDSMVLNKVRLTEDSLFNTAKPASAKALYKGWLLKNPIAERDSTKAKWKVPSGRVKRRWFVLNSTSEKRVPALLYYTDNKEAALKGTLYLGPGWNVQRVKSEPKKFKFELFSETQGVLVEASTADEAATWMHYIETLLRQIKRTGK